jgi:subtilisin-like proprotein convertase family protein
MSPVRPFRIPLPLWLVAGTALAAASARADFFSATNSWSGADLVIPDGQPEGVSDTIEITLPEGHWIEQFSVTLDLVGTGAGGFNGDLYVTLVHGTGYSVLLNRVGRTDDAPFGYADSGFSSVTFSSDAPGDIHLYREFLFSNPATPLGGPLTGTWQPDGRATDPALVLDTDPRTATFDSFLGNSPNGEWTLFLADLSPGGETKLQSWSIAITTAVPEPSSAVLTVLGAAAVWLRRRR